ncbi:MAG TPA: metallophosphoesterase [Verrucomicrobiae bacterium]|nr:metallophosphoesterase [Verrucomicrobiae bacterium]
MVGFLRLTILLCGARFTVHRWAAALCLSVALIASAGLRAEPLSFMVVDDVHYASEEEYDWPQIEGSQATEAVRVRRNVERSRQTFLPLMRELKEQAETATPKPAAIFSCGDLVHGGPAVRADLHCGNFIRQFESIGMPIPLLNANGNHEMAEAGMEQAYDRIFVPFLARQVGRPLDARHYSIDLGDAHCILLDGLPPGRNGGDHETRLWALGEKQWAWLEADLEANKAKSHIFVFTHATLWPLGNGDILYGNDPTRHRALVDLLLKHNVRAIFAGHKHTNCVTVYEDNGRQLVQMIPNSHLASTDVPPQETRTIAYTPEAVVPRLQTNWDRWGRNLVTQYQSGIVHHEQTPGMSGYFLVAIDGPTVTVRMYRGIGKKLFREYVITRDPTTGASRFQKP